ncbi:fungal-specific transcription factor domain-containing protein [Aspergillus parasiticus]|uniref:Fungal-specific transcription factor domain-containing protein n=1 Tax=Aspergillus parasiticus TaxID=5067 RepID=A0A5N6DVC9_ASPPA|nr:fungal-specific transcription factor domain-containing protein [Aspergillus parasiticus]
MKCGVPCTNCRLDGAQCSLAGLPRRKYLDGSSLPRFIRRLPGRLQLQEIELLRTKGALIVPKHQILRPLIEAYIDHVHPYMPVIDIHQLLITIFQKNAHGRLSLFLLQAILFTGAHFIAENLLVTAGYGDRDTARRIFFQRAKVLYDLNVEEDQFTLVQGLLLLSFWHGTPDDTTSCWHWAGLSVTHALRMGLQEEVSSSDKDMHPHQRGLRRRLWWSVYIRDCLTALWMQRLPRIPNGAANIPILTIEDFGDPISSIPLPHFVANSAYLSSVEVQNNLASSFIDYSTLCVHVNRVLQIKFSLPKQRLPADEIGSVEREIASDGMGDSLLPKLRKCESELHRWSLETGSRYDSEVDDGASDIVRIQISLVQMLYSTAFAYLLSERFSLFPTETTFIKITQHARRVTEIMTDISKRKTIQYLPVTAVTIIVSAIAVHVMEISSPDPATRSQGYQSLNKGLTCLNELSHTYPAAGLANILYEASTFGSSAGLPFEALHQGRGIYSSFTRRIHQTEESFRTSLERCMVMGNNQSVLESLNGPLELEDLPRAT